MSDSAYIYFINLNNKYIKFGRSKRLIDRMKHHHHKFVVDLHLCEKLNIIKLIKFTDEKLCIEVECRLKKFISYDKRLIKMYGETEIILYEKCDEYIEKIEDIVNNIANEYNLTEPICRYLTTEHILEKYNKMNISKYKINKINKIDKIGKIGKIDKIDKIDKIGKIDKINKFYCFRCSKETSSKSNLHSHLRNKIVCKVLCLDIPRETIISNYFEYLSEYENCIKNKIKNTIVEYVCEYCNKKYIKSNSYNVHIKNYCKIKKKIYEKQKMDEIIDSKNELLKSEYEEKLKIHTEIIENKLKELENKISA
jgi:hypothetical protein